MHYQFSAIARRFASSSGSFWSFHRSLGLFCAVFSGSAFAQAPYTPSTSTSTSAIDTVLAGVPGVLIASLALIFAIRERGRARQLEQLRPGSETAANSPIALWQIDQDGKTIYANNAALTLFGAGDLTALNGVSASVLLRRGDAATPGADQPYQATVCSIDHQHERRVLVFERALTGDSGGTLLARTLVAPDTLPDKLPANGKAHTEAA